MYQSVSNSNFSHHLLPAHKAFAESRSTSYVYVPNNEAYFQTLDHHCDVSELESKLPLIIVGDPGSGKSALLANWARKRQELQSKNEFLFLYFVECTSESQQLAIMLSSMEIALKEFFNLREMEVPTTEERLRWSLGRFMDAAAKKYSSSRLLFVIDGVNRLQSEDSAEGTLKWLPNQLPPNVRFLISTVKIQEQKNANNGNSSAELLVPHRSYLELKRRGCSMLSMEPLSMGARSGVITAFNAKHGNILPVAEEDIARILDASATAQPLFLRILLQALKLGVEFSHRSIAQMLDEFLSVEETEDLVLIVIEHWIRFLKSAVASGKSEVDLLGRALALTFVARHGLSDEELWGAVSMSMRSLVIEPQDRRAVNRILEDCTFTVANLRSFSHEVMKKAVWQNYVQSPENCVRFHLLLAKYFKKLSACDRKLAEMPYHLEVSGNWKKLKSCLTELDLLPLWCSSKHRGEFLKLWGLLTSRTTSPHSSSNFYANKYSAMDRLGGGRRGSGASSAGGQPAVHKSYRRSRQPCDIVEEYTKRLDEYIISNTGGAMTVLPTQSPPANSLATAFSKKDEAVAEIVLKVGEILLEFGISGHEIAADVPMFTRPEIPVEDLRSLGVPHLTIDEEGRSVLLTPSHLKRFEVGSEICVGDISSAAAQQGSNNYHLSSQSAAAGRGLGGSGVLPVCTTYFYQRWMWTNYQLVALANCGRLYALEVQNRITETDASPSLLSSKANVSHNPSEIAMTNKGEYRGARKQSTSGVLNHVRKFAGQHHSPVARPQRTSSCASLHFSAGPENNQGENGIPPPGDSNIRYDDDFEGHQGRKGPKRIETDRGKAVKHTALSTSQREAQGLADSSTDGRQCHPDGQQHKLPNIKKKVMGLTQFHHPRPQLLASPILATAKLLASSNMMLPGGVGGYEGNFNLNELTLADVNDSVMPVTEEGWQKRINLLTTTAHAVRSTWDSLVEERLYLEKRLAQLQDERKEITELGAVVARRNKELEDLGRKEADYNARHMEMEQYTAYIRTTLAICRKHAPRSESVLSRFERQIATAKEQTEEVAQRLRGSASAIQQTTKDANQMIYAMAQSNKYYNNMLITLTKHRDALVEEMKQHAARMKQREVIQLELEGDLSKAEERNLQKKDAAGIIKAFSKKQQAEVLHTQVQQWEEIWDKINKRTGISNPQVFIEKFTSRDVLEAQLREIRVTAERRLTELREKLRKAEAECEELKYGAMVSAGGSRDIRDKDASYAEAQFRLRRARQTWRSSEELRQQVVSGVHHIAEIMKIPVETHAPVAEVLSMIERSVAVLLEEKEKQKAAAANSSDVSSKQDTSLAQQANALLEADTTNNGLDSATADVKLDRKVGRIVGQQKNMWRIKELANTLASGTFVDKMKLEPNLALKPENEASSDEEGDRDDSLRLSNTLQLSPSVPGSVDEDIMDRRKLKQRAANRTKSSAKRPAVASSSQM